MPTTLWLLLIWSESPPLTEQQEPEVEKRGSSD